MSLSAMEQKLQTVLVRQKMSTVDEEGKLRQVLKKKKRKKESNFCLD